MRPALTIASKLVHTGVHTNKLHRKEATEVIVLYEIKWSFCIDAF